MVHITVKQNSFSAGEISDKYLGRDDLNLYNSGALLLQNFDILPSGAVQKRPGLKPLSALSDGNVRLHKFAATPDKTYLLIFSPRKVQIFNTDTNESVVILERMKPATPGATGAALPWQANHLDDLDFTQCPGFLLICHADLPPMVLIFDSDASSATAQFGVENWPGKANDKGKMQHYALSREFITHPAENIAYTLQILKHGSRYYLAAKNKHSGDIEFLTDEWQGKIVRVGDSLVECQESKIRAIQRYCKIISGGVQAPTTDFAWVLWSANAGWPSSASLYRGRLIFSGSKQNSATLYMSKIGDYYRIATAFMSAEDQELDDSPIEVTLQRDDITAIRHIVATRHLHVFTDTEEWVFDNDVITPTNIKATPRTGIGFHPSAKLAPFSVNNTIIASDSRKGELHEYFHAEIDDSYSANNLNHLTEAFEDAPTTVDYDSENRRIYCAMPGGEMRVLALYEQEKITAWSRYRTLGGEFKDVTCIGKYVYVVVARKLERHALTAEGEKHKVFFLEKFSPDMTVDHYMPLQIANASSDFIIHPLFAGREIRLFSDGLPVMANPHPLHRDLFADADLTGAKENQILHWWRFNVLWGGIRSYDAVLAVGLPIEVRLEAFPPVFSVPPQHRRYRLLEALFYVKGAENFDINIASRNISFTAMEAAADNPDGAVIISGEEYKKVKIKSLGWHDSLERPPWVFIHNEAEPMILLGAEMRLSVN